MSITELWRSLDPQAPPHLVWIRPVEAGRAVFLLGAFDPPTVAHEAVLRAAALHAGLPGVRCLTKVLLDRPAVPLLPAERRLELLDALARETGGGVAAANRGTYLDVLDAARRDGVEPVFVIGSDKLPQLQDPSFYPDGHLGVRRTFAEARFIVVPRGVPVTRRDVEILPADRVFHHQEDRDVSATRVRDRVRRGEPVDELVPRIVAVALQGYTGRAEAT